MILLRKSSFAYYSSTDTLRDYQLSKSIKLLQISNGYLKLTSGTPGLSNPCNLRFKSNITGIFATDIYRVGDICTLTLWITCEGGRRAKRRAISRQVHPFVRLSPSVQFAISSTSPTQPAHLGPSGKTLERPDFPP